MIPVALCNCCTLSTKGQCVCFFFPSTEKGIVNCLCCWCVRVFPVDEETYSEYVLLRKLMLVCVFLLSVDEKRYSLLLRLLACLCFFFPWTKKGIVEVDPDMKMFFRVSKFLNKRFGVVPPEKIRSFYDDYHRYLKSQGVHGVKVDAQSVVSWGELISGWL